MADKKIGDVTHDTNVTGIEKVPLDDSGTAKYATIGEFKDYVVNCIENLSTESSVSTSNDKLYLLKYGTTNSMKVVSAATIAQAVLDYGFSLTGESVIAGYEKILIKNTNTKATITANQLKNWITSGAIIPWSSLSEMTLQNLAAGDYLVVRDTSASDDKKVLISSYTAFVHAAFKSYVESLSTISGTDYVRSNDIVYLIHNTQSDGTVERKVTISQLISAIGAGDVIAPTIPAGESAVGKIPAWSNTDKTLTIGYSVQNTVRSGTGENAPSANAIPTEAAVRAAVNAVSSPVSSVNNKTGEIVLTGADIAVSSSDSTKINEKIQSIEAASTEFTGATSAAAGTKGLVPAPNASDVNKYLKGNGTWAELASGSVMGPATTTENKIPQWDSTNLNLKDGLDVTTAFGETTVDTKIPTEKAVDAFVGDQLELFTLSIPFVTDTSHLAGQIPIWGEAPEETTPHVIAGHKSVVTAISNTTSDDNILTEKAVATALATKPTAALVTAMSATTADTNVLSEKAVETFVNAKIPYAKSASTDLTGSTTTATLVDHAVNRILISTATGTPATGGTYTLTLPTAKDGFSRDFYVVFVQSGALNETSTINLSGQVHGKSGTVSALTLKKDVSGSSNAYHVYHFVDDNTHLWCVNVFEFVESGVNSGVPSGGAAGQVLKKNSATDYDAAWGDVLGSGYVRHATETLVEEEVKTLQNNGVYSFNVCNAEYFTLNITPPSSGVAVDIWIGFYLPEGEDSSEGKSINPLFICNGKTIVDKDGVEMDSNEWAWIDANCMRFVHLIEVDGKIVVLWVDPSEDEYAITNASSTIKDQGGSLNIYPYPGEFTTYTLDSSKMTFNIDVSEYIHTCIAGGWYEFNFNVINEQSNVPTVTVPNVSMVMLPNGVTAIGSMFKVGFCCSFRMMYLVEFNGSDERYCSKCIITPMGECAIPSGS